MVKNNYIVIVFLLFFVINNIFCNDTKDYGTGGKLIENNSDSSSTNNQNKLINHHSHNHGYNKNKNQSTTNNKNNQDFLNNYYKKHNHTKNIINEKDINIKDYKQTIIIERDEIEIKDGLDDYNNDIVNLNCFKINNVEIQEVLENSSDGYGDVNSQSQDGESINDQDLTSLEKQNKQIMKIQQIRNKYKIISEIKENIKYHLDWNYLDSKWRCVDSFKENSFTNFNTFGGSIGEFIISFHLFQDQTNQRIDDDYKLINEVMKKFLNNNGDTYLIYHSSEEIYEKLLKTIKNSIEYYKDKDFDIQNVEEDHQKFVLRLLKNPEFIGCKFIKQLVLGDSSGILNSISPILVKNVIESFFNILWNEKSEISNVLFEIDDHSEMVSIAEIKVDPVVSCIKKPLSFPKIQQRLNHNNPNGHKAFYIVQDDETIRLGIRDKIAKYFYDELLCDEHHLEKHRKKDILPFNEFKATLNNKALIFRESCINNIKKGNEPHYKIQFNIILPAPLNKNNVKLSPVKENPIKNNQVTNNFNRNNIKNGSPLNSQQLKDIQEMVKKENEDSESNKQNTSSVKSFFSGLFVVFIVLIVGLTVLFGYISYKKRNEKYKSHKRLENVFSLEDDIEDEFDL
ncbi:hypothetical protein DICPUDRAFT_99138 [Dictyostelium purpureum]|uniref:Uncharacterized protein n=1 Tax=Dictyostelium purpureum TaxID=5786 RepID=F0ZWM5_DICPU|nr:uncharacterized protein DICPUDRAFT_99138 [Dictyostelium purpureum]EGC31655.1 hypothetical protein DICPUDRAFT_99138 [Dictyostelium purpureum]|eukprot:XP_003291821.1 hypothetical protein DICPUDRAFT_99138 [Dictyostelium purpureum]